MDDSDLIVVTLVHLMTLLLMLQRALGLTVLFWSRFGSQCCFVNHSWLKPVFKLASSIKIIIPPIGDVLVSDLCSFLSIKVARVFLQSFVSCALYFLINLLLYKNPQQLVTILNVFQFDCFIKVLNFVLFYVRHTY